MNRQITICYPGEPGSLEKQIKAAIISVLEKNGVREFKMQIQPEGGGRKDGEK